MNDIGLYLSFTFVGILVVGLLWVFRELVFTMILWLAFFGAFMYAALEIFSYFML